MNFSNNIFLDPAVLSATPAVDHVLQDPAVISAVQSKAPVFSREKVIEATIAQLKQAFKDPAVISAANKKTQVHRKDIVLANRKARKAAVRFLLAHSIHRVSRAEKKSLAIMASRFPVLNTTNLPTITDEEAKNTISPARGAAMKNQILKQLRVPEFRFLWQFWAEKGQASAPTLGTKESADAYASRPKPLGDQVRNVKDFYEHYNNIPTENLKNRGDSIHLFHLGVKPLWEDPRNARGGAYYFRVSRENAAQFWHEICVLAVGDVLQGAVETKRECKSYILQIFFSYLYVPIY